MNEQEIRLVIGNPCTQTGPTGQKNLTCHLGPDRLVRTLSLRCLRVLGKPGKGGSLRQGS